MIGKCLPISLLLIFVVSFGVFGQETATEPTGNEPSAATEKGDDKEATKPNYLTDKFQFTANFGAGYARYQWILTGAIQADFNANPVLGIGFRSTFDYGLKYENLNINIYALFKIWWFYLGPGVSFIAHGMALPADDPDYAALYKYPSVASLAFTGGFRFPIVRIGPGFMTMDLSVDWYQTDIPLTQPNPPLTGQTIEELLNGSTYAFKFCARLGYTF